MTTYNIAKANERHHQVARLAALGMRHKDIAAKLGITTAMVRYTLKSELLAGKIEMIRGTMDKEATDLWREINEAAADAVHVCTEAMNNPEIPISERLRQGRDFMDRAGFVAPKRVQVSAKVALFDADKVAELRQRAEAVQLTARLEEQDVNSVVGSD